MLEVINAGETVVGRRLRCAQGVLQPFAERADESRFCTRQFPPAEFANRHPGVADIRPVVRGKAQNKIQQPLAHAGQLVHVQVAVNEIRQSPAFPGEEAVLRCDLCEDFSRPHLVQNRATQERFEIGQFVFQRRK